MDTDGHKYDGPDAALTYEIIGCAMEVLNELGHGLNEKPYENALVVELDLHNHKHDQQHRFEVSYKGVPIGEYVPDLIVDDRVIVDTKVIEHITDVERGQMLNYLRIAQHRIGLILNFKRPKLEWDRVIL